MYLLGNFVYTMILLLNAMAILSEDRFLARVGFASVNNDNFGQGADQSVKAKITNLVNSVRMVMKVPLIVINSFIILYELLLG
jgi:hypothetical protein